jgi:DNA-binding NtrC family response regulator
MKSLGATKLPVVLVDPDPEMLVLYKTLLHHHGIEQVVAFHDGRDLLPFLMRNRAVAVVLDLLLPTLNGQELLQSVADQFPRLPVIIVTGLAEVSQAVSCMRAGACDYLLKPIRYEQFLAAIERARSLTAEDRDETALEALAGLPDLVTEDRQMLRLLQRVQTVSGLGQPVLITGEAGVGKELIAQALHLSGRSGGALITINVSGMQDQFFCNTLFGHQNAGDGTECAKDGLIKQAAGGTLFLDEIGALCEESQQKLLRLIREHEYLPLGSDTPSTSDARIVVATNHDPQRLLAEGRLREDLYRQLCCHHFHVPPLRERSADIPLLLDHFLTKASREMGKHKPAYQAELPNMLERYAFPGNVRELQALVYDAVALHEKGSLSLAGFRERIGGSSLNLERRAAERESVTVTFNGFPSMRQAQTLLISEALRIANGNQGAAATLLGISRQALNNRLRRKISGP